MANRRLFIGVGVVLAVAAVAAVGVTVKMKGEKPPEVLTSTAVMGDIEYAVLATGSLQPFDVVNVGTEVSGQVLEIKVKLGDHVTKGQLMAVIDSQQLENRVRNAESQLARERNMMQMQSSNLQINQSALRREQQLKTMGVGTPAKLEQTEAQVRNAESQIAQQNNNIRQREIEVEAAKNDMAKANIKAPMDAIVAEVVARQGSTVNANQSSPTIVRLAKMDVMTVRAQISEADIIKIRTGQKVYFTILGDPSRRYYATLRTTELTPANGVLDPTQGGQRQQQAVYYNALFEVPNPEGTLLPAMTAEVHVVLQEARNVLTIQSTALGERLADGRYKVQVVKANGQLETRTITVGINNNFLVEVKAGLKAGDRVVIGQAGGPTATAPASSPSLFGRPAAPPQ